MAESDDIANKLIIDALVLKCQQMIPKVVAYDILTEHHERAEAVLAKQPKSYLGWNWAEALCDALEAKTNV